MDDSKYFLWFRKMVEMFFKALEPFFVGSRKLHRSRLYVMLLSFSLKFHKSPLTLRFFALVTAECSLAVMTLSFSAVYWSIEDFGLISESIALCGKNY